MKHCHLCVCVCVCVCWGGRREGGREQILRYMWQHMSCSKDGEGISDLNYVGPTCTARIRQSKAVFDCTASLGGLVVWAQC